MPFRSGPVAPLPGLGVNLHTCLAVSHIIRVCHFFGLFCFSRKRISVSLKKKIADAENHLSASRSTPSVCTRRIPRVRPAGRSWAPGVPGQPCHSTAGRGNPWLFPWRQPWGATEGPEGRPHHRCVISCRPSRLRGHVGPTHRSQS